MKAKEWLTRLLGVLSLTAMAAALIVGPGTAQSGESVYFEETGHSVEGIFLTYFRENGGVEIFGYPISGPFIESGIRVQYFQNARLEEHPLNPEPYRVQLGLLGDQLNYRQPPVARPQLLSRRRHYFPETGQIVSFAFLDYFKSHGGIDLFGYPITQMYFEDGRIVQYFQRLKLEWHPEHTAAPVQVGNLGEVYVSVYRERLPPSALEGTRPSEAIVAPTTSRITSLRMVVSVRYSVLLVGREENQIVSVLVSDNNEQPVPNAQIHIELSQASGRILSSTTALTDARGFVQVPMPVTGGKTGEQVVVRARGTFQGLEVSDESVFLIW